MVCCESDDAEKEEKGKFFFVGTKLGKPERQNFYSFAS